VPKVSREHRDARRTEILGGARRAFARHGYAGTTVARLEEEIGLSRGAIFNYFDSKLDLFVELARAESIRLSRLLAEEGVDAAIRAIGQADRDWLTVLIETEVRLWHDPDFERRMASDAEEEQQSLLAGLERAQAEGRLRADVDLPSLAGFVLIVANGLAVRIAGGDTVDIDSLIGLVNDALGPREAAQPAHVGVVRRAARPP
jgi:TetR/AcrR family transcriptional regulator, transcriptional repressor of aconitase